MQVVDPAGKVSSVPQPVSPPPQIFRLLRCRLGSETPEVEEGRGSVYLPEHHSLNMAAFMSLLNSLRALRHYEAASFPCS